MKIFITVIFAAIAFGAYAQTDPSDYPGLEFWISADQGLVLDASDKVEEWVDQSPNAYSVIQGAGNLRPLWVDDVINEYPVVRMDGFNDFMIFPAVTNIRTVFWVIKEDPDATSNSRSLLGHNTSYHFLRGPDQQIWNAGFSSSGILEGTTQLNFEVIDGTQTTMPGGFSLISLVTTEEVEADQLTVDRNLFTRVWDGDIAEIIMYSQPLDSIDVLAIENYLADKYTPELVVNDDVDIEYGFCDTTLCASPGFSSYLWSSGDETECISVNQSGTYTLSVIDVFERTHQDTVVVNYPGSAVFEDQSICLGDNYLFDSQLNPDAYTFLWQDESSFPFIEATEEGNYQLQITDSLGCTSLSTMAFLDVDSITSNFNLGLDTTLCGGSILSSNLNGEEVVEILWSTDSASLSVPVFESGSYWVQGTNNNGCEFSDTINIVIEGLLPQPGFILNNYCEDADVLLTDTTSSFSPLAQISWSVDGIVIGTDSIQSFLFDESGLHTVVLEAEDESGCIAYNNSEIFIHPAPAPDFIHSLACSQSEVLFLDQSQITSGFIAMSLWHINGLNLAGNEVTTTLTSIGPTQINQTCISDQGCISERDSLIFVLESPDINSVSIGDRCLGSLSNFELILNNEAIADVVFYDWDFGDGTGSFEMSPDHLFAESGTFTGNVLVVGANGCPDELEFSISIFDLPIPIIATQHVCTGYLNALMHESIADDWIPSSGITWEIQSFDEPFTGSSPDVFFESPGFYEVGLTVVTSNGCTASTTSVIEAHVPTEAELQVDPEFGPPPLEVSISANPEPWLWWQWNFGNGETGEGPYGTYTYEEEGIFEMELILTDDFGCVDTTSTQIFTVPTLSDLQLFGELSDENGVTQLTATVKNNSNYIVNGMAMSWTSENQPGVTENWNIQLQSGQSEQYLYISHPEQGLTSTDFICMKVRPQTFVSEEISPFDNKHCLRFEAESNFEVYHPFPNPADELITFQVLTKSIGSIDELTVTDVSGRPIFRMMNAELDEGYNEIEINTSEWAIGTYILSLSFQGESYTEMILIARSE